MARLIAQALVGSAIIATGIYVPLLVYKHLGAVPAFAVIVAVTALAWVGARAND
jgi:hypothetical protein